ncbi:MAG: SDR family oxidoreductase [Polyangiaceae bacterium]|nr:SDR family oxidoreductase [Polyangiaceae bacterium]
MSDWTEADIPSQAGKVIVVTGANSGLGFEVARAVAAKGAHVVIACRSLDKGQAAAERIRAVAPSASLEVERLDLADLGSVRAFATAFAKRHERLDVLCNNAGVMALPQQRTKDGFEMQIGTNHLGHFALTGELLPVIRRTPGARVVTLTSTMHKIGFIRLDDIQWERGYKRWPAYGQSKIANLMFAYELERRFEREGIDAISVAAHPGYAATNLQLVGPAASGSSFMKAFWRFSNRALAQSAQMGALPTLYAMTEPSVRGGDFIGPSSLFETRGHPAPAKAAPRAKDANTAARLWELSEQLTHVRYLADTV